MGILAKNRPLPGPMPAGLVGWFLAVAVSILVSVWDADLFAGRVKPEPLAQPRPVPSEGLAALYPGDEGLKRDPRVLFVENFETGNVPAIGKRWGDIRDPENMDLSDDVSLASPGKRSLHIRAGGAPGQFKNGGHLYAQVRAVEKIHVRFYVKFPRNSGYLHHSTVIIADGDSTPWPKGYAGKKPAGDRLIAIHIEPWSYWGKVPPPGAWCFYSYWHEMKPDGRGDFWGNIFDAGREPIQPGRWYCIEAMVKANAPPQAANGEQAFWVDGKLARRFQGIRWRSSDKLKFNAFWLLYHVSENTAEHNRDPDPRKRVYEIWFDDVVLATEYIGPIKRRPKQNTH
jgi:hypothetical protein